MVDGLDCPTEGEQYNGNEISGYPIILPTPGNCAVK